MDDVHGARKIMQDVLPPEVYSLRNAVDDVEGSTARQNLHILSSPSAKRPWPLIARKRKFRSSRRNLRGRILS